VCPTWFRVPMKRNGISLRQYPDRPQFVHEALGRRPFYSASSPGLVFGDIKGVRSYPVGNDEVGARQVRTLRNEQKCRRATLANKVNGEAP